MDGDLSIFSKLFLFGIMSFKLFSQPYVFFETESLDDGAKDTGAAEEKDISLQVELKQS